MQILSNKKIDQWFKKKKLKYQILKFYYLIGQKMYLLI